MKKKSEIGDFIKSVKFQKKTDGIAETPIINACKKDRINFVRFKTAMDEFSELIRAGVDFESQELHKSNLFPEIQSTTEALNQWQNCFDSFIKRFYREWDLYKGGKSETPAEDEE